MHPHTDTNTDITQKNGILSYSNDHPNKNLSVSQKVGLDYFFFTCFILHSVSIERQSVERRD